MKYITRFFFFFTMRSLCVYRFATRTCAYETETYLFLCTFSQELFIRKKTVELNLNIANLISQTQREKNWEQIEWGKKRKKSFFFNSSLSWNAAKYITISPDSSIILLENKSSNYDRKARDEWNNSCGYLLWVVVAKLKLNDTYSK